MITASELAAEIEKTPLETVVASKPVEEKKDVVPVNKDAVPPVVYVKADELSAEDLKLVEELTKEPTAVASTESKTPTDLSNDVKEKITRYDAIMSNPNAKAAIEYFIDSNGTIEELINKAKPETIDWDSKPDNDIFEMELTRLGLNEEDKKNSRESFSKLAPYEKKDKVNSIKDKLKSVKTEPLGFEKVFGKTKVTDPIVVQKAKENADRSRESLTKDVDSLIEKGYKGYSIPKEDKAELIKTISANTFPTIGQDGIPVYDYKEIMEYSLYKKYGDSILANTKKQAVIETLKKSRRPSTENVSTKPAASQASVDEVESSMKAAFQR